MRTTKINQVELDDGDALSVIPSAEDGQHVEVFIKDEEMVISFNGRDALHVVLGGRESVAGIYLTKGHIIEVAPDEAGRWTEAQVQAFTLPLTSNEHMALKQDF